MEINYEEVRKEILRGVRRAMEKILTSEEMGQITIEIKNGGVSFKGPEDLVKKLGDGLKKSN